MIQDSVNPQTLEYNIIIKRRVYHHQTLGNNTMI
uniref:Uncharacterized protein n=1 Tax=Cucumis melo TaxID=3656 RepID=A0A9I9CD71_CUCME